MRGPEAGWRIADYAAAYAEGATAREVIASVLTSLADAPSSVLIGPPLVRRAQADAARLPPRPQRELPLYGVPFVVKDNIDVAGVPTTAGCPGFAYEATSDATIVNRLRAVGAVVVGKANLDQFATGLVGTRSPYGTPANVLDSSLVPGGSSSGSAVAVALGLVPFSLGTDTAGSGRVPAAMNSIVGMKPTLGSTSAHGIVPAVRRLDCPSVFARTVTDAALVARLIRGIDECDPFTRIAPPAVPFRTVPVIGIPAHWETLLDLSADMARWFKTALGRLSDLGVELRDVDVEPLLATGRRLYGSPIVAERTTAVGDAIAQRVAGLDPVVARIIAGGAEMSAVDAYRGEYDLTRLRASARHVWRDIDALALPVTPRTLTIADVAAEPIAQNDEIGRFTTFANLLDLTVVVVPMKPHGEAVPAGLQLIAPAWSDDELLRLGDAYETGSLDTAIQPCTVVVAGAHLTGLPLNHQLVERRATLVARTTTAAEYRLYALPGTSPSRPGLARASEGVGAPIEVELWSMSEAAFGSFVQQIPQPLCIGSVTLADGSVHKGFLCEQHALEHARDITDYGSWRAYLDGSAA